MHVTNINGINIHHRQDGPKGAPAVVLINSLGTDFRAWDSVAEKLCDRYRVIRYDKPGHGLSDIPDTPYSIEDHARDLAGLLDGLEVGPAILCGLSVGGMIALGLAEAHPERVRALVLADTAHRIGTAEMWNARIESVRTQGLMSIAEPVMARWFTKAYRENEPNAMAAWTNMLCRTPVAGYTGTCTAIRDADLTSAAQRIRVPTLCLCGDQDGATPPDLVRALAKLIPGAEFKVIENSGHLPCVEQPEAFVTNLQTFTGEHHLDESAL